MEDMLLELMQQKYAGIRSTDASDMTDLYTRITDYIWYTHLILTNFENAVQRSHRFLSHFFHLITQKDISTLPNNYKKQFYYNI